MKRKKREKQYLIYVFFLLLLGIGLGYAIIHSDLVLNGTADIGTNTWDIHFNNVQVATGSVDATTPATINPSDNTKVNYAITLEKPGDYYEFTVDIVNAGTLPGKISLYSVTGIDSTYEDIIDYSINYTNGKSIQVGDILNAGATKTVKVRTYFNENIDADDLPEDDFNLNLEVSITYIQSDEEEVTTDTIIQQLKVENSSCFTKYEGQVTDQVGQTVTSQNVYFNRCADKRNIKFNNMCWQIIRTTETGGIKMIYNGDVVDGKCESTRGTHKGIVQSDDTIKILNSNYLYGDSFTYDTVNNTFTLINTTAATWSDSTYENLLGKFTCISTSDTCTTIYQINSYYSNATAYLSYYTITDTNYAQIGTSAFNANDRSPAMVGYMFNKVYNYKSKSPGTTEYKYGSGFTYDTNTNTYTLSGTTQNISDWSTGYNTINNTHYTCWNTSGTCSTISYIYYTNSSKLYYIDITGGNGVDDELEEMLSSNVVNRYNSSIKGIIDAWYKQNIISKTNMLEDTVYCNARNIINYGGWDPEGGSTSTTLQFKNYSSNNDLSCVNETDQFAVSNNKAKLTYPVALATYEELFTLTNNNSSIYFSVLTETNASWCGLSPNNFDGGKASVRSVDDFGNVNSYYVVDGYFGVRPVVSLATGAVITEGDGSETNPWVIE